MRVVCERLRPAAIAAGGNLVVLSSPNGTTLTANEIWGPPPNGAMVMRALRQRFDPDGILNPGRFVLES
jgi:glycolate oxidase FAD binding subunit